MHLNLFAVLLTLAAASASALPAGHDLILKLSRARNPTEAKTIRQSFNDLKIARLACRIQLAEKTVPAACYETLRRERDWGIHTDPKEVRRLTQKLDEACVSAADNLRLGAGISEEISAKCRARVRIAKKVQDYRREDDDAMADF